MTRVKRFGIVLAACALTAFVGTAQEDVDPKDPLYLFRQDGYAQLGVNWYY